MDVVLLGQDGKTVLSIELGRPKRENKELGTPLRFVEERAVFGITFPLSKYDTRHSR